MSGGVRDTRQWIEAADGSWINPISGGVCTPCPCGWCGEPVCWVAGGDRHEFGRCVVPEAAKQRELAQKLRRRKSTPPSAPERIERPTTAIVVRWPKGTSGEDVRGISRAFAQELSKRHDRASVTVRTYGTVPEKAGSGGGDTP